LQQDGLQKKQKTKNKTQNTKQKKKTKKKKTLQETVPVLSHHVVGFNDEYFVVSNDGLAQRALEDNFRVPIPTLGFVVLQQAFCVQSMACLYTRDSVPSRHRETQNSRKVTIQFREDQETHKIAERMPIQFREDKETHNIAERVPIQFREDQETYKIAERVPCADTHTTRRGSV
jgi:hypothetical protein